MLYFEVCSLTAAGASAGRWCQYVEETAFHKACVSHSKLPMVLKVPRLNFSPLALCDRPFSLLGFGDILVPGISCLACEHVNNFTCCTVILVYTSCTSASDGQFDLTTALVTFSHNKFNAHQVYGSISHAVMPRNVEKSPELV